MHAPEPPRRRPHGTVNVPTLELTYNGTVVETFLSALTTAPVNDVDLHWAMPKTCFKGYQWPLKLLQWTYYGTPDRRAGPGALQGQ